MHSGDVSPRTLELELRRIGGRQDDKRGRNQFVLLHTIQQLRFQSRQISPITGLLSRIHQIAESGFGVRIKLQRSAEYPGSLFISFPPEEEQSGIDPGIRKGRRKSDAFVVALQRLVIALKRPQQVAAVAQRVRGIRRNREAPVKRR